MNKKLIVGLVAAALSAASGCCTFKNDCGSGCGCTCACVEEAPNISVFAHYVRSIAKQRGITPVEAANLLYDIGVRGFDIGPDDALLPVLAQSKLKPINFYFFPNMFGPDNGAADCKRCLDQAVKYGVPRVMVVPSHFTEGGEGRRSSRRT